MEWLCGAPFNFYCQGLQGPWMHSGRRTSMSPEPRHGLMRGLQPSLCTLSGHALLRVLASVSRFFFFFIKLPSSCSPSNASWLCMRNCRGPGHQKRVLWNWSAQWLGVPGGAEVVEMLQRFQESGNLYTRGSLPRVLHRAAVGQTTDPQHYSCAYTGRLLFVWFAHGVL